MGDGDNTSLGEHGGIKDYDLEHNKEPVVGTTPRPAGTSGLQFTTPRVGVTAPDLLPPNSRTDFEKYSLNEMVDLVNQAQEADLEAVGDALWDVAREIKKAGVDLGKYLADVDWDGEGGRAFHKWGAKLAKDTELFGNFAATVSVEIKNARAGLKTVQSYMPKRNDAIFTPDELSSHGGTNYFTGQKPLLNGGNLQPPGSGGAQLLNGQNSYPLFNNGPQKGGTQAPGARLVASDSPEAKAREKDRQEAIGHMNTLSSYYQVTYQNIANAERDKPVFDAMPPVALSKDGPQGLGTESTGPASPSTALSGGAVSPDVQRTASASAPAGGAGTPGAVAAAQAGPPDPGDLIRGGPAPDTGNLRDTLDLPKNSGAAVSTHIDSNPATSPPLPESGPQLPGPTTSGPPGQPPATGPSGSGPVGPGPAPMGPVPTGPVGRGLPSSPYSPARTGTPSVPGIAARNQPPGPGTASTTGTGSPTSGNGQQQGVGRPGMMGMPGMMGHGAGMGGAGAGGGTGGRRGASGGARAGRPGGIVGGTPNRPGGSSSSGGVPRGNVVGGEPSGGTGRTGLAGLPGAIGAGGAAGGNRDGSGRRVASAPGGIVGTPTGSSGQRGGQSEFTPGGTGLVDGNAMGAGGVMPPVGGAPGGRDRSREQGGRPDYLTEDEETWSTQRRNIVPPVVE